MTRADLLGSWYLLRSYETYLLHWIGEIDRYCGSRGVPCTFFGGAAVSGYAGHLVRKLHDLDVLVPADASDHLDTFLLAKGFTIQPSVKAGKAGFRKYTRRDHLYEMIVSIFPGQFTLLDVDSEDLPVLGRYDFLPAMERSERRTVRGVGDGREVELNAVAFEDLLFSRLWPTFEPSTVHDLLLLIGNERASRINYAYLAQRAEQDSILRELAFRTFEMFEAVYSSTAWWGLATDPEACARRIDLVRSHLFSPVR